MMISVSYAMACARQDELIEARTMFWASAGKERAYWRGIWRELIREERRRLQRERAVLMRAVEERDVNLHDQIARFAAAAESRGEAMARVGRDAEASVLFRAAELADELTLALAGVDVEEMVR